MLEASSPSPRRASISETASGNYVENDNSRCINQGESSKKMESHSARSQTPRDNFQTPHFHRQRQPHQYQQRNMFKNMPEQPHLFPTFIQEHGRWELQENGGMPMYGAPRLGPPRRMMDKDTIDFQSLPILKQPHRNIAEDVGNSADLVSDEKYRSQIRSFPELPAQAHERIRELGNEIVACYSIQLCKFYNDTLVETTPNSFAVFTKKNRTGQRWLMVFRHDRGRVSVKYNKLLTNQLLVRCLNPVSVEVDSARTAVNAPQETCVFTFTSHSEATKFLQDIQESQSIAWNHREVLLEQSLRHQEQYLGYSPNFGHFSPRPLSARYTTSGYMVTPADIPPPLTPRNMKLLPPVPNNRPKRSPFTVSSRTPRADLDDNWRHREALLQQSHDAEFTRPATPNSVVQSPIRKRSKGGTNSPIGGDGDFVYNSLTHAMALQQNVGKDVKPIGSPSGDGPSPTKETVTGKSFPASEVLVSNKRDVGTGAPDEEFFSLGSGDIRIVDNGEEQFDDIKCFTSEGQLMFSQILYGWNKVRHAEGCQNPKVRWWIGAAALGTGSQSGETHRIREFKATFTDEETAEKFTELFQVGANKGNNPEVRKKYLAQSLRV